MPELIIEGNIIKTPIEAIMQDIKRDLMGRKLAVIEAKGDDIKVTCPSHKGGAENKPSCQVYIGEDNDINYGTMHCFTCGEKGPFFHFVALCFNQSDEWARGWLIKNYGEGVVNPSLPKLPEIILDKTKKFKSAPDSSILDTFVSWHPYLEKRKITRKVAERFHVKYDPQSQCVVFPVYDIHGNFVGLTRRSVNNKIFIIDENLDKSNIYLLNEVVKEHYNYCIICESQINALTCWGYDMPAVALLGCGTTDLQMKRLNKTDILHFILMYDNDKYGRIGAERFKKMIAPSKIITDIIMPQGKDVNDLNKDEFEDLLRKNNCIYK